MFKIDGLELAGVDSVVGLDLSLTGPGLAVMRAPWGDGPPFAMAATLPGFGKVSGRYASALSAFADKIIVEVVNRSSMTSGRVAVMESVLNQSGTGKATERGALWWMVAAGLERNGFAICTVHPTTRRTLSHDDEARKLLADARDALNAMKSTLTPKQLTSEKGRLSRLGKKATLQAQRRRWPDVAMKDDNAADALVCAELGARGLGWAGLPPLVNKNLPGAIRALGIEKKE